MGISGLCRSRSVTAAILGASDCGCCSEGPRLPFPFWRSLPNALQRRRLNSGLFLSALRGLLAPMRDSTAAFAVLRLRTALLTLVRRSSFAGRCRYPPVPQHRRSARRSRED